MPEQPTPVEDPGFAKQFLVKTNLPFRAACNEVLDSSKRPIKERSLNRLIASKEVADFLDAFHKPDEAPDSAFALRLSQDPFWKTLVLEAVRDADGWQALFKGDQDKVLDAAKTIGEKLWGFGHPATKAAAAAVLSVAGLDVANVAATKLTGHTINVPLSITADPNQTVKLKVVPELDPASLTLKLQLPPSSGGTAQGAGAAGTTGTAGNVSPCLDCSQLSATFKRLDDSFTGLSNSFRSFSQNPITINPISLAPLVAPLGNIEKNVGTMTASVIQVPGKLDAVSTDMRDVHDDIGNAKTGLTAAVKSGFESAGTTVKHIAEKNIIAVTLRKGRPQGVVLPYYKSDTGIATGQTVLLTLTSTGVDKNGVRVANLSWQGEDGKPTNAVAFDNRTAPLIPSPKYGISLNATSKQLALAKWLTTDVANVTLVSQP